jgi:hypothetical protein
MNTTTLANTQLLEWLHSDIKRLEASTEILSDKMAERANELLSGIVSKCYDLTAAHAHYYLQGFCSALPWCFQDLLTQREFWMSVNDCDRRVAEDLFINDMSGLSDRFLNEWIRFDRSSRPEYDN